MPGIEPAPLAGAADAPGACDAMSAGTPGVPRARDVAAAHVRHRAAPPSARSRDRAGTGCATRCPLTGRAGGRGQRGRPRPPGGAKGPVASRGPVVGVAAVSSCNARPVGPGARAPRRADADEAGGAARWGGPTVNIAPAERAARGLVATVGGPGAARVGERRAACRAGGAAGARRPRLMVTGAVGHCALYRHLD